MQKEHFVKKEDVFTDISVLDGSPVYGGSPLYRYDTLTDVLNTGNLAVNGRQQKSAMYSSISNEGYSNFYYDTLLSPVQINNRLAILPSSNPFLLNFLGVRYLETFQDQVPPGYQIVKAGDTEKNTAGKSLPVLAENENVLPVAYTTSSLMSQSQYEKLNKYDRLDAITRYTIVPGNDTADKPADAAGSNMMIYEPSFEDLQMPDRHARSPPFISKIAWAL